MSKNKPSEKQMANQSVADRYAAFRQQIAPEIASKQRSEFDDVLVMRERHGDYGKSKGK